MIPSNVVSPKSASGVDGLIDGLIVSTAVFGVWIASQQRPVINKSGAKAYVNIKVKVEKKRRLDDVNG